MIYPHIVPHPEIHMLEVLRWPPMLSAIIWGDTLSAVAQQLEAVYFQLKKVNDEITVAEDSQTSQLPYHKLMESTSLYVFFSYGQKDSIQLHILHFHTLYAPIQL